MLIVHRAERADALVVALGELLAHPAGDPFTPELVAVPSRGVERWLAQQLSHTLGARDGDGVCANVVFPSAARLLDDAAAEADPQYAAAVEAWDPGRAVWPVLAAVDAGVAAGDEWCVPLAAYLGRDDATDRGRRFAAASKLARLFDAYGRARPAMLIDWRDGRDDAGDGTVLPDDLAWQAELWRRVRAELGPAPAERLEAACAGIVADPTPGPAFSIFGATRFAPSRVRVLGALGRTRDVHLWVHHPSPALWAANRDARPGLRADAPVAANHPLLASMSRDVRELQQLLAEVEHTDVHHPLAPRPATRLGRLQDDLAHDRAPSAPAAAVPDDDSIQVHAAHGPARQVEILREAILGLLARDPTLEPRDIVIMCPDVETFAPLVAATFELTDGLTDERSGHPASQLRVALADRSLRQANPLLRLLAQVLELAAGRVTATELLDLAGLPPVRRRFGLDDDDLERLRAWTVGAGARWGLDAAHRDAYHLAAIGQGTWRGALDRVLTGVAMEDGSGWLGDTLPLDEVDSGDIELAGRFAELVARVEHAVDALSGRRPAREWARRLDDVVTDLGAGEYAWQGLQVHRELDEIAEYASDTQVALGLADVTALLHDQLAGRPTRASFRTGTLTVCTLVPMRSVPHRVVCLLGMDDGVFPRKGAPDGDDVLARDPRTGERDVRSEDRQLFLDAVCAAEDHLVITYTGADPRSGVEVPPCVPLAELLDTLDGAGGHDRVVVRHPLQPFDPRNFAAPAPFSFDPAALAGARAATRERVPVPPLVDAPLAAAPATDVVPLDDVVQFLGHPVRGFLRQRLDVATSVRDEDPDDAVSVELDGLAEWAIGERVLRACVAGQDRRAVAHLERLRGDLPPGPLGDRVLQKIGARVDALLAASAGERERPASGLEVAVPLPDGRVLAGTVPGVRGPVVLATTYSTLKARQRLTAWVRYLATVATTGDADTRAVTVGRARDDAHRSVLAGVTPELARRCLALLVGIRDIGLRVPLPLALETSCEYARRRLRMSVGNAESAAANRWATDRFAPERDDAEHVLVFGPDAPLRRLTALTPPDDAVLADGDLFADEPTWFGSLARLVWDPLLTVETEF